MYFEALIVLFIGAVGAVVLFLLVVRLAKLSSRVGQLESKLAFMQDALAKDWQQRHDEKQRRKHSATVAVDTENPTSEQNKTRSQLDVVAAKTQPQSAREHIRNLQSDIQAQASNANSVNETEKETPAIPPIRKPSSGTSWQASPASTSTAQRPPKPANKIIKFFTTGNIPVKVGMLVLFFGVAFLLKYASEQNMLPIELRLIAIGMGAIALLYIGWNLRIKNKIYALVMQGGGVGSLYLLFFASFKLYHLIPKLAVFPSLIVISVFSALLAILQNSRALAVVGISGGFLAPILMSTGGGSHVSLFSYYLVLNIGIVIIAFYKSWRILNLLGFAFTFIIGTAWGVMRYQPEFFWSTEPFLITFFAFYVLIAILFSYREDTDIKAYVDGTLVFGTPLVCSAIQVSLVKEFEYGIALSALAAGSFYIILATGLFRFSAKRLMLISEAYLALGVVFLTLAIPFAVDGRFSSAAWALEGAGILWIAVRQNRTLAKIFALLLQLGAGLLFFDDAGSSAVNVLPVFNSYFTGTVFMFIAGFFSAWYLQKNSTPQQWEHRFSYTILVWSLLWWFAGGLNEINKFVSDSAIPHYQLVYFTFSCGALFIAAYRLQWNIVKYALHGLLPLLMVSLISVVVAPIAHPFAQFGYLLWPIAYLTFYSMLRYVDRNDSALKGIPQLHAVAYWLLAIILSWEVLWFVSEWYQLRGAWLNAAWIVVIIIAMEFILHFKKWPIAKHGYTYITQVSTPLIIAMVLWSLVSNFYAAGGTDPLPYMPIMNPIDIIQVIIVLVLTRWYFTMAKENIKFVFSNKQLLIFLLGLIFLWLNAVLVRTLHHWAGIPFDVDSLFASILVQMSISIYWSIISLFGMLLSTQKNWRRVWIGSAILYAIVVVKLFFIDLWDFNTIERVISFMAVGILLLIVGYFSPIPPENSKVIENSHG